MVNTVLIWLSHDTATLKFQILLVHKGHMHYNIGSWPLSTVSLGPVQKTRVPYISDLPTELRVCSVFHRSLTCSSLIPSRRKKTYYLYLTHLQKIHTFVYIHLYSTLFKSLKWMTYIKIFCFSSFYYKSLLYKRDLLERRSIRNTISC